jgi:UPF0755 protein
MRGGEEMLDDLDLAWEDQNDPRRGAPRSRQARRQRRKERKRRRRSFGALFMSFLLLAALGGGVYWGVGKLQEVFGAPDYTGNPAAVPVNVKVNPGDSSTAIGEELYAKKVVKSVKAFVNAAKAEPRSTDIQPGTYKLFEQTQASVALSMLLDPDKYMLVNKVTIPEGKTVIDTFNLLSKATGIPVKDFADAAKDPEALGIPDFWFKRDDGKKVAVSLEGFLFPDTYRIDPELNAEQILKMLVNQFLTVADDLKFADTVQANLEITPFEALIVASLAQVEAGKEEDFGKVARVAYNRVYKEFACNCLGFDVVVNYWLQKNGKPTKSSKDMGEADLHDPKNPYNTHDNAGLPPGPISNPGKAALEGAMNPPKGNWLYFVAIDKNGTTRFAVTAAEHEANKAIACRNGVLTCP